MNTAAPSRKKLLSLVLTLVFMLTCLPAALAVDLNVDAGFYFKQSRWRHLHAGIRSHDAAPPCLF
ncbi:MAG: hypothetical protein ACLTSA_06810 [Faecalibacterium sp.]